MPLYLSRFSYTPETWARLIANPEDRRKAAESYIESVGGKLHGFWYGFGTHDGYNLGRLLTTCPWRRLRGDRQWRCPQLARNDRAADRQETMAALGKAEQVKYRAPGA